MNSILNTPIEDALSRRWRSVDGACKMAFFAIVCISVLAFGFEMTNLTLHHDDVLQIFIQDTILGHYLGRFGVGWLHYYTQDAYFMPFLQMAEGIVLMAIYGVLIAHFWGVKKTLDMALVGAILCVFPYMANVYQYNTSMATYPLAHLLAALAVVVASRATISRALAGATLFTAAFSIYQAVVANAATVFVIWLLIGSLFKKDDESFVSQARVKATVAVAMAAVIGGLIYVACVSLMDIKFDSEQAAGEAFSLSGKIDVLYATSQVLQGTRRFFVWPENYFPGYLKDFQLILVGVAGILCLWIPKQIWAKGAAALLLVASCFAPRVLQLLHPQGTFHSLTLTAYALVIAGALAIIIRAGPAVLRNASVIVAVLLLAGYVMQCNWVSTVNYLNTQAHFSTLTQVLARVRSLPDTQWDGRTIAVVGSYDMSSDYPFKGAVGVAPKFMDAEHMGQLARLVRDPATFIAADRTMPGVLEYAATHPAWPAPSSVGIVGGVGVVVLSKPQLRPR